MKTTGPASLSDAGLTIAISAEYVVHGLPDRPAA